MVVLSLSARTPEALEKASRALADWLVAAPRDLRDVAYTLGIGRTAFPHRRAVVGAEAKALARALRGDAKATGEGRLANLVVAWEAAEAVDLREDHVDEAAMLDGDALGPTG
ncbi:MAG: CurL C-terminal domain-containing protein, partial [Sphingomonas oligoaromativorans]